MRLRQHRKCWVIEVGNALAGIVIRKGKTRAEAGIASLGNKILKLHVQDEKFGEQLLKQCLWFAQSNGYDVVYRTCLSSFEEQPQH